LKELRVFRLKTFGFHLREASPIHHDPTQPSYDNTGLVGSECTFRSNARSFLLNPTPQLTIQGPELAPQTILHLLPPPPVLTKQRASPTGTPVQKHDCALDWAPVPPDLDSGLPCTTAQGGRAPIPRKPPPEKNQENRGDRLTRHTIPDLRYVQRSYRPSSTNDTPCSAWSGSRPLKKKKAIMPGPKEKKVKVEGPRKKHQKAIHKLFCAVSTGLSNRCHIPRHQS